MQTASKYPPLIGEDVKRAMMKAKIHRVDNHACPRCKGYVFFLRVGDKLILSYSPPECWDARSGQARRSKFVPWSDAVNWIHGVYFEVPPNDTEDKRRAAFGLPLSQEEGYCADRE